MVDFKNKVIEGREIKLESPENEAFGDYSTNIAMVLAKEKGLNPRKLAESIVEEIKKNPSFSEMMERVEIAGPGFINFWFKTDALVDNLRQIDVEKENYGKSNIGQGKVVVIDYSSPNIAKPFGIGHLRSTIIGQALYNLYKSLGYEVVGDNHLGDWGTQFGKLLYMIKSENVTDFDIASLEKLYVKFHELSEKNPGLEEEARVWFKKLEDGDSEAKKIWQKCVDISIAEFDKIYKILGIKIDFAFGESYYGSEMRELTNNPDIKKNLSRGEKGALVVNLDKFGIKTPLMILKSDGATTYAARDLAAIKFRVRKWNPSIIIYEVGEEQNLHFQQIFAAAKLLKLVKDDVKLFHTAHGLYLSPDGKKFSTRKGKTIKLEEVLNEAEVRAGELANKSGDDKTEDEIIKLRREVGIGAIKYFDLMHSVRSDVVFDWDKIMNMEGNSGPYLQYTAARCNSVIAKSKNLKDTVLQDAYNNLNLDESEMSILRSLIKYNDAIEISAESLSPNVLCSYLYDLAQKYNAFYASHRILSANSGRNDNNADSGGGNIVESDVRNFRISLTRGILQVLKNGLDILGIEIPERM